MLIHATGPAGVELERAAATPREPAIVRHQHERRAEVAIELEQQIRDPLAGVRIQITGGLVREQHGGLRDERARDRHALLLAARQLFRVVRRPAV